MVKTKYIDSMSMGVPKIKNEFGSLVKVLKGALVDGFNEQSVLSVSNEGTKYTLKLKRNHGFATRCVVVIGTKEYRVTETGIDYIQVVSEEPIEFSDELKVKIAPLGYELVYDSVESTGVACFKNQDGYILKVLDNKPNGYTNNAAKFARVVMGYQVDSGGDFIDNWKVPRRTDFPDAEKTGNGVAGMGGIHNYTRWSYALYPRDDSYQYDYYEPQSQHFPTNWRIVGDGKTFYLMIQVFGVNYNRVWTNHTFGTLHDGCLLVCAEKWQSPNSGGSTPGGYHVNTFLDLTYGHGDNSTFGQFFMQENNSKKIQLVSARFTQRDNHPNRHTLYCKELLVTDLYAESGGSIVGVLRGMKLVPMYSKDISLGKDYLILPIGHGTQSNQNYCVYFSLGDWDE